MLSREFPDGKKLNTQDEKILKVFRLGHDARYAIDPRKTLKELGFYTETPFTVGIEKTIRWY